eukprot:Selendium_serpulae@DN6465_c2_g2_i1.p2
MADQNVIRGRSSNAAPRPTDGISRTDAQVFESYRSESLDAHRVAPSPQCCQPVGRLGSQPTITVELSAFGESIGQSASVSQSVIDYGRLRRGRAVDSGGLHSQNSQ